MTWPETNLGTILGDNNVITILRFPEDGQQWGTDGRSFQGAPAIIGPISASVQPLKQSEWQQLDLGGRLSDWRKIYTETEIRAGSAEITNPKQVPDLIIVGPLGPGTRIYKVVQVIRYDQIYPHYKAILKSFPEGASVLLNNQGPGDP